MNIGFGSRSLLKANFPEQDNLSCDVRPILGAPDPWGTCKSFGCSLKQKLLDTFLIIAAFVEFCNDELSVLSCFCVLPLDVLGSLSFSMSYYRLQILVCYAYWCPVVAPTDAMTSRSNKDDSKNAHRLFPTIHGHWWRVTHLGVHGFVMLRPSQRSG